MDPVQLACVKNSAVSLRLHRDLHVCFDALNWVICTKAVSMDISSVGQGE